MSTQAPLTVPVPEARTFAFLYRILTERKNEDQIELWLISQALDYTIFAGKGAWHGARENSMAIELATATKEDAEHIARSIKKLNEQEAIIVQELPVVSTFL